jgi:hypothetical protein
MLPSQISLTSHLGSKGLFSISGRGDFERRLTARNARIKKTKANSNVMLHPIDNVGQSTPGGLSTYSF